MEAPKRIPITLITGFLGCGKTTLFSRLLRSPEAGRIAAIVNEFGEIDLDHDLLEASSEDVVVLGNGCLCCAMRGNLAETLRTLEARRQRGPADGFDRVVIETSGLADPVPVLRLLLGDPWTARTYSVTGVVTLVDAVHGERTLLQHPEARSQVRLADLLIVTKSDLADVAVLSSLDSALSALNPRAERLRVVHGDVDPSTVCRAGGSDIGRSDRDPTGAPPPDGVPEDEAAHGDASHGDGIRTAAFRFARPLAEGELGRVLTILRNLAGPDLLRAKGIFTLADAAAPVVVHAVQDLVSEPEPVPGLGPTPISRLVLIGRALPATALDELATLARACGAPVSLRRPAHVRRRGMAPAEPGWLRQATGGPPPSAD